MKIWLPLTGIGVCADARMRAFIWQGAKAIKLLSMAGTFYRDIQPILEDVAATRAGLFQIIRATQTLDLLKIRVGHKPIYLISRCNN